jgi:rubrerythrin
MLFGGGWIVRQVERRSAMVCRVCGYDLKGLSGETCPECGGRVRIARPDPSE